MKTIEEIKREISSTSKMFPENEFDKGFQEGVVIALEWVLRKGA